MAERPTLDDLQARLAASPFNAFCGFTLEHLDFDAMSLVMSMPKRPEVERRPGSGQWHGGPVASLIDTAGDYAMALHVGGPVPTINFRTDYLRPATGDSLTATATVRRAGRTVGVVDVDVADAEGRLVAIGRGTYSGSAG